MKFDEILDFLFHRIAGICIMIASTVILCLGLSGCIVFDFLGCYCQGCFGCNECRECWVGGSENCDEICYECFSSCGDCTLNDCLYGKNGCQSECGNCYVDCGGVNYSCFEAACFECNAKGCYEVGGYDRYSCLNCIAYCDAHDDPGSPIFSQKVVAEIKVATKSGETWSETIYNTTKNISYTPYSGYTFKGYFTKQNGKGTRITDDTGEIVRRPDDGDTIYPYYVYIFEGAEFTIEIYGAKLNSSGQITYNVVSEFTVSEGDSMENRFPIPKEIAGYEFRYWKLDNGVSIGNASGPSSAYETFDPANYGCSTESDIDNPIQIYPVYDKESSTVTIKYPSHMGYSDSSERIYYGGIVGDINEPYVSGYQFLGFSLTEGGPILSEDYVINQKTITLYANFSEIISFYTYDNNNGYSVHHEVPAGTTYTFGAPAYTQNGYKCIGWYSSNDTETLYDEIVMTSNMNGVTFYPRFEAITYTISYYDPNVSLTVPITTQKYQTGSIIYLESFNKEYCTFYGWCFNQDGSGYKYDSLDSTFYGDINLYASYSARECNIYLDPGEGYCSYSSWTVSYGSAYSLPVPTRTGFRFLGWYCLDTYGNEVMFTDGDGNGLEPYTVKNNVAYDSEVNASLTAKWEVLTYKVTFMYYINGKLGDTIKEVNCVYGNNVSGSMPVIENTSGYTFKQWLYFDESGTNLYSFDTTSVINRDMVVVAELTPRVYTDILLLLPGNDEFFQNTTEWEITVSYTYGDESITYINGYDYPTKEGYTFKGWAERDDYTYNSYNAQIYINPDGTVTDLFLEFLTSDYKFASFVAIFEYNE